MTIKVIKRCQYRHCNKVVEGNKKKKFCCDNCRKMEFTYLKRESIYLKNEKKIYRDMLNEATLINDNQMVELYNLIYKK